MRRGSEVIYPLQLSLLLRPWLHRNSTHTVFSTLFLRRSSSILLSHGTNTTGLISRVLERYSVQWNILYRCFWLFCKFVSSCVVASPPLVVGRYRHSNNTLYAKTKLLHSPEDGPMQGHDATVRSFQSQTAILDELIRRRWLMWDIYTGHKYTKVDTKNSYTLTPMTLEVCGLPISRDNPPMVAVISALLCFQQTNRRTKISLQIFQKRYIVIWTCAWLGRHGMSVERLRL